MVYAAEQHGSPAQQRPGGDARTAAGGNLEGKELRFGIATRALGRGHHRGLERLRQRRPRLATPGIGGLVPLVNMVTGEVIFGGVGSGLYGMLLFVLLAVFIAGLMVGRTPEYLGKKIEAREVKLVMLGTLAVPLSCWCPPRWRVATKYGAPSIYNPGPQGFSETLYAYASQAQQQRLGVRRLHGLRPAQLARQRRRLRHHLRRPAGRRGHAVRPLRAAGAGARGGRLARRASASPRPAPAPSAPTRPRSWFCSSS